MSLKIGIVGLGFMGRMHFITYPKLKDVKVTAICDVDAKKRTGDWSGIVGNIGDGGGRQDLSGIRVYADAAEMLKDPNVDVVDITLPTYLHAPWTIRALQSGRHVICEKPMAINSAAAATMVRAAQKARRRLFIGQCIRFWPVYTKARELVLSGKFGKVVSAIFTRVSTRPTWSWQNWLLKTPQSGSCALDLHIHDADFIMYLMGRPRAVTSRAAVAPDGGLEHITTHYQYGTKAMIQAEAAWEYAPGFPFSMQFRIALEKATLFFSGMDLMLCPKSGAARKIPVADGDGYFHELNHFADCIRRNKPSAVVPPESAMQSVSLVEAEMRAARTGKTVTLK